MGKKWGKKDHENRSRARWTRVCCSVPWAESIAHHHETLPDGLVTCKHCEHRFPDYYVNDRGVCFECYLERLPKRWLAMIPSSISIVRF